MLSVTTKNPTTDANEQDALMEAEVVSRLCGSMLRLAEDSPKRSRRVAVDKPTPPKPSPQKSSNEGRPVAKRLLFGIPALALHKVVKEDEMGMNPALSSSLSSSESGEARSARNCAPLSSPKAGSEAKDTSGGREVSQSPRQRERGREKESLSARYSFSDTGRFLGAEVHLPSPSSCDARSKKIDAGRRAHVRARVITPVNLNMIHDS